MKLLPRSLFHRNLLLIVSLIVLSQVGNALVYREFVLKPRIHLSAESTVRNLEAARRGLRALSAEQRAAFVAQFNAQAKAASATSTTSASTSWPEHPERLLRLEHDFIDHVSRRLALSGGQLTWHRDASGAVALRVDINGDGLWLDIPGAVPGRQYTRSWLAASASAALLALLGAWLIQRRINQPLQALVAAASALGRGERPPALAEDGPTEIATLAHGFNEMVAALAGNEDERMLMLAGLSHDLRTPLAKMRLATEMLQGQGDADLLASLNRSVESLDGLLTQFLDYTRAASSTSWDQEALVDADLNALIDEVIALCPHAPPEQGLPLELQFDAGEVQRMAMRPQAVQRLVLNLITNAQRHGAPPIEVVTGQDKRGIWLEVRDRGPGIPADRIHALKMPFARGHASRSGISGAGLGLTIVERIAQAHGARFDLSPRLDGGLVAKVQWPLRTPNQGRQT